MNKEYILEVLQASALSIGGADYQYLLDNGFIPGTATMGIQLADYLKTKELQE